MPDYLRVAEGASDGSRRGAGITARLRMRISRRRIWTFVTAAIVLAVALVQVTVTPSRVHIRWAEGVGASDRVALEQRYSLGSGEALDATTWRYELENRSRENIAALVRDPAVSDTAYIDRPAFAAPDREIRIAMRPFPFPLGPNPWQLFHIQSLCLLLPAGVILWAARSKDARRRRDLTLASLLIVGAAAYVFPIPPSLVRMGDANTYTASRENFESYAGVRQIRYEAHLSHAILGRLDRFYGRTAESPSRSLDTLMRFATIWFVASALAIGFIDRWSPVIVRYLGLAVLAPSALLYFGYRELGHLSLNIAAFPLLVRGLRHGTTHLEAGSALWGLGSALHGFGLLSLAGAGLAALATRVRLTSRLRLAARITAWGTAASLGWVAVYMVLLKLPIVPGHADAIPWRPWLVDEVTNRVNVAILSATGARDLLFTGWVVGLPLIFIAASLWRRYPDEVRAALVYAVPSVIFLVVFWPIQGLGVEMDLIVAAFPALYAAAWVCAHEPRHTWIAGAVLVSAHLAFWRIVLDPRFVNSTL
jgi:hypothetical protein